MGALRLAKAKTTPQATKPDQTVITSVFNMFFTLRDYCVFSFNIIFWSPTLTEHYRFYHWTQLQAVTHSYRIEVVRLQVNQHCDLTATLQIQVWLQKHLNDVARHLEFGICSVEVGCVGG